MLDRFFFQQTYFDNILSHCKVVYYILSHSVISGENNFIFRLNFVLYGDLKLHHLYNKLMYHVITLNYVMGFVSVSMSVQSDMNQEIRVLSIQVLENGPNCLLIGGWL